MKLVNSKVFCAILLGNFTLNSHATENMDLITVESSTIDINHDKKTQSSSSATVSKKDINKVTLNNINDVLKAIPGTTISTRRGEMAQIHFRGLGQQQFMGENSGVAIIVDGVPVMQQAGGIRLNLKDIESMKVIKGSASYLYGDTALAGALIITTKKPKDKNSIDLEATLGSFNYQDYLLSAYKSSEDYALNINGNYRKTDGYWTDSELWTKSINGKFGYFLDDSSDISFSADITDKYDQAGSRSVNSGLSEAKLNPKGNGDSYTKDNYIDLDKYTLTYNKDFDSSNFLVSTYYYNDLYDRKSNPQDLDNNPLTAEIYTNHSEQNLKQKGIKAEYSLENKKFATLFGVEIGQRNYENNREILENYTTYDRRQRRDVDHYKGENEISEDNETITAFYSELKYNFTPKFTSIFNIRYDQQRKKFKIIENKFDGTSWDINTNSNKKSFNNFSYRLGTTYQLNEKQTLFANVSTAFETPDIQDLDSNPNVKEQKSINYELGLRGSKNIYTYETSIFHLKNKGIIGPEGGTYSFGDMIDNAGDTKSEGFELSLGSNKEKTFSFDLAYTYLDTKYTKYNTFKHTYQNRKTEDFNIVGNTIPRTSKHTINLFLNYKATQKLTLISELYAKSSYYADETNMIKMPGYSTLNLQARYKTKINKNKLEFFAKVKNVFDKQFFRSAYLHRDKRGDIGIDTEDASIVVDPGREFYAGIKYSF